MADRMKRAAPQVRGPRGRAAPGPNPIDVHVGRRLRERRTILGLSQQELGRLLGVTFQQIQKNERGTNRMSASRLFEAARVLDTNVQFFFDEMPPEILVSGRRHFQGVSDGPLPDYRPDPMVRRETIELVRAYYEIPERKIRQQMVNTIRAVAHVHAGANAPVRPRRGRPPKKGPGRPPKA